MSPEKVTQRSARSTPRNRKNSEGLTEDELAAMKDRVQELKAFSRGSSRPDEIYGENVVLAKIAEMSEPDRSMALRLHTIITTSAPALTPRTWYGMPAYEKDGKVVCFFQNAQKFKARYATLGFNDKAHLDEGAMWPVAYALKELTAVDEAKISALVKKAVS